MAETDGRKYKSMVYDSYQIDRPSQREFDSNAPTDDPYSMNSLNKFIAGIGPEILQHVFNTTDKFSSGSGPYRLCMITTRHLLCVGICAYYDSANPDNTKMYFVDVEFKADQKVDALTGKKTNSYTVLSMRAYKLNRGEVPGLKFGTRSETVGLRFGNPGTNDMPGKLPVIGISARKLFMAEKAVFIEGLHVPIYKQPFIFDWHYENYNREKDATSGPVYEYNCSTENLTNGAFYSAYFNRKKS